MSKTDANLESLLSLEGWARSLARDLVRDLDHAEDLVQQTFLAAIRRPPAADVPVKRWLAKVMRNLTRFDARSMANRRAREEGYARSEDGGVPADHAMRVREASTRLRSVVEELGEPYRTRITERYLEELNPRQIAQRWDLPVKTIKSQLHRALEQLRVRMDREMEGDRDAWVLSLAPLLTGRLAQGFGWGSVKAALWIVCFVVPVAGMVTLAREQSGLQPISPASLHYEPELRAGAIERDGRQVVEVQAGAGQEPRQEADLLVQVLDASGTPLRGAPVMAKLNFSDGSSRVDRAKTEGSNAVARFAGLRGELHTVLDFDTGATLNKRPAECWLQLDALTSEDIGKFVGEDHLIEGHATLQAPDLGSVTVDVFDEFGVRLKQEVTIMLMLIPQDSAEDKLPEISLDSRHLRTRFRDGRGRFPWVEAGQRIAVAAWRGRGEDQTRVDFEGPLSAGEEAVVDVRLGADHPMLRVRVLDEAGIPLTDRKLRCRRFQSSKRDRSGTTLQPTVDAEGYLLMHLRPGDYQGDTLTLYFSAPEDQLPWPKGSLQVSGPLTPGLHDLGNLTLRTSPAFAAGRVITLTGDPVPQAKLALRFKAQDGDGWLDSWHLNAQTDANGNFEIHSLKEFDRFQVAAEASGYVGGWVEFKPGDQDIVIPLQPGGRIIGRVLLNENIPPELIHVSVARLPGDVEHKSSDLWTRPLTEDGSFQFGNLLPGTRRVTLSLSGQREILLDFPDVVVRAGGVTLDPRLNSVDLRGKLFLHEIQLKGDINRRDVFGVVDYAAAGSGVLTEKQWFRANTIDILSSFERIDALVSASGYRSERVEGVKHWASVELLQSFEVTLVLKGPELPAPPIQLKVALSTDGIDAQTAFMLGMMNTPFEEDREVRVAAPGTGQLQVHWLVESDRDLNLVELDRRQYINVIDSTVDQRFELELSQAEMDQLVKGVR